MTAMRRLRILALSLALASCERAAKDGSVESHPDEARPHDEKAHEAADADGTVRIDPGMLRDLRITTAKAEARAGGEGTTILGELRVNESAYAEVGSPIPARIAKLLVSPGDAVTSGQALAELESVELGKARADYLAAKARGELAARALSRKQGLVDDRIAPRRELEEAEAEAASAAAAADSARATLQALGISADAAVGEAEGASSRFVLRAPIAGTVLERSAVRGQSVDASRTLFRIADLSSLWLVVHAFERDALRVKVGSSARITFPALPGRTVSGAVALVGSQVDTSSRTIPVRIELPNEDRLLRPGMSASAWVPLDEPGSNVLAVPAAALQRVEKGWCVFVPKDEGAFEIRLVGRGRDLGDAVEVLSGLKEGETIVVQGAFLLKAEVEKARGDGEHDEH
jgi:membrane fusion protein, heavy metal efflux system